VKTFAERVAEESMRLALEEPEDPDASPEPIRLRSRAEMAQERRRRFHLISGQLAEERASRAVLEAQERVALWRSDPQAWKEAREVLTEQQIADLVRLARG